MSAGQDGGPACRCGASSVIRQGHQWLCAKHYRHGQMRANAKRKGKVSPTADQMEAMTPSDMACKDCGTCMVWRSSDSAHAVASLQHYRDGTMAIVCRSCNTRHAYMPGDTYRDMPKDHKYCPSCSMTKHESEFSKDAHRPGPRKIKSTCKACSYKAYKNWSGENRGRINERQRARRANASG